MTVIFRLIRDAGASKEHIGGPTFIKTIHAFSSSKSEEDMAKNYNVGVPTLKLILDGLQQPLGHDMREGKEGQKYALSSTEKQSYVPVLLKPVIISPVHTCKLGKGRKSKVV